MSPSRSAARVALVGTFDVDNYGDHLFPRVAVAELGRRLPGVVVDAFSPFGTLHARRFTGGPEVHPLGPWTPDRLDAFAARYDAVVVGGGELLHLNDPLLAAFYGVEPAEVDLVRPSRWFLEGLGAGREEACPVLWHALGVPFDLDPGQCERVRAALHHRGRPVVRDARSQARLRAAGVRPPVVVVPDSGLLVDRVFPAPPPPAPTLVLQGCDLLVPFAPAIAAVAGPLAAAHGLRITLVETGPCRGDGRFADAVAAALPTGCDRLPPTAGLDELAAVLGSAGLFVGSSLHGAITALVHGRPFVLLDLGDESKLRGFVEGAGAEHRLVSDVDALEPAAAVALTEPPFVAVVRRLQREVDRHFDALAAAIAEAADRRAPDERPPVSVVELDRRAVLAHIAVLRGELGRLAATSRS